MSTYVRLHCPTHGETAPDEGINHGWDRLAAAWRARRKVVELHALAVDTFEFDGVELSHPWMPLDSDMRHFLATHAECEGVQLLSEYGDREDVDSRAPLPPNHCRTCTCEPR